MSMAAGSSSSTSSSSINTSGNSGAKGGVWAFYYIQGEDGEDRSHPNAFRIPAGPQELTLGDVLRHFPLPDATAFHFRFRVNTVIKTAPGASGNGNGNGSGGGTTSTFFWLDVTSPAQPVPLTNGRVICKLLRLARPTPVGLIFKRKPVLKWAGGSSNSNHTGNGSKGGDMAARSVARQTSGSGSAHRPTKYSDASASQPSPPARASSTGSGATSTAGAKPPTGSAPVSRSTSDASAPAPPSPSPSPPAESFEDFLSGSQSGSAADNGDGGVSLMQDSSWSATTSTTSNPANDFLSSMDPLAARAAAPPSAAPRSSEQPKFEDDCGQTVGPVSMAEMNKFAVSSDGSKVYNASKVDKSTKSESVRRAMEERERQVQRDMERARGELRAREEAKLQLSQMKEGAQVVLGPKLKAWAEDNGRVKNIRTLLSTMHQVMWDGSRWSEVNMGKLIQPNDIKKNYRKAMIVVHPDKSSGRNAEQLLIAERVFAALNTAWDEFSASNQC